MTLEFLVIANISPFLSLVAVLICLYQFNTKQSYIRLLGLIPLIHILSHLIAILSVEVLKQQPNYVLSISNLIELPATILVYYHATNKANKTLSIGCIVVFLFFGLINIMFIQQDNINSYTLIMMSIMIIINALYYFYWLILKLPTTQLQRLPMFWVNSAWMIFHSGTLFLFVFTDYLVQVVGSDLLVLWNLHNILKIIEIFMIVVALWIDLQNIKSRSSLA
jgi:hypothetical protein